MEKKYNMTTTDCAKCQHHIDDKDMDGGFCAFNPDGGMTSSKENCPLEQDKESSFPFHGYIFCKKHRSEDIMDYFNKITGGKCHIYECDSLRHALEDQHNIAYIDTNWKLSFTSYDSTLGKLIIDQFHKYKLPEKINGTFDTLKPQTDYIYYIDYEHCSYGKNCVVSVEGHEGLFIVKCICGKTYALPNKDYRNSSSLVGLKKFFADKQEFLETLEEYKQFKK